MKVERADTSYYLTRPIPAEFGRGAYSVERLGDPVPSHVLVSGPNTSHCDCLGFLSSGMCRHLEAVLWMYFGWQVGDDPPAEFGG